MGQTLQTLNHGKVVKGYQIASTRPNWLTKSARLCGGIGVCVVGAANNLPLAAAIALIPIAIIFGYLFLVRRTGALDNL